MTAAPDVDALVAGVGDGDRTALGRAITLVESNHPEHQQRAAELLDRLAPLAGDTHRIGISGVPGAGKSTFIEAVGMNLVAAGHRVAVLAVDPSSSRSGGSILGDKTRMARLATSDDAFIRPSPSSGVLGGVARATRESIVVVEAAGYDTVLVETVGVGQSETMVANMVDTFVLLMLARTGDSLQGIKKGVLELADVIAVNKADGPHADEARAAARELAGALHLVAASSSWTTPVLTCSATTGDGLDEVWEQVVAHRRFLDDDDRLVAKRRRQAVDWMWAAIDSQLGQRFRHDPRVAARLADVTVAVEAGTTTPTAAALDLLAAFEHHPD